MRPLERTTHFRSLLYRHGTRIWQAVSVFMLSVGLALGGGADAHAKRKKRVVAELQSPLYAEREDAMQAASDIAEQLGLDADWARSVVGRARYQPAVAKLILPPEAGTAKDWAAYRARFLDLERVRAGAEFWRTHAYWLEQAEREYGVPPEIVVGILGVETLYGRRMGDYRVIDALATLSFDFPAGRKDRGPFFREELGSFLTLCHRLGCDPLELRGSYAGALGMPQFMPSSWNKYAIDFDGDGQIDLHNSAADVIGSIARYLADFGWQRGLPTHFEVAHPTETADRAALLAPDIVPSFTPHEFAQRGAVLPPDAEQFEGKLALVELQNGTQAPIYVAGTRNFYAITRYNWSAYYAMAVIELGRAVAQARSDAEQ